MPGEAEVPSVGIEVSSGPGLDACLAPPPKPLSRVLMPGGFEDSDHGTGGSGCPAGRKRKRRWLAFGNQAFMLPSLRNPAVTGACRGRAQPFGHVMVAWGKPAASRQSEAGAVMGCLRGGRPARPPISRQRLRSAALERFSVSLQKRGFRQPMVSLLLRCREVANLRFFPPSPWRATKAGVRGKSLACRASSNYPKALLTLSSPRAGARGSTTGGVHGGRGVCLLWRGQGGMGFGSPP